MDDPTGHALEAFNLDLGVFLVAIDEEGRRRLELQLRQKHGF